MRAGTFFFLIFLFFLSCTKENNSVVVTPAEDPPISIDLSKIPYPTLSEYGFFKGEMKDHIPAKGVVDYEPASQLFTDYASKKRFLWLPDETKMTYVSDDSLLSIPIGAVLFKTFFYEEMMPGPRKHILETRLMIHHPEGWKFAEYIWNEEQTEALLHLSGQNKPIQWLQNGEPMQTTYRIPSEVECLICHKQKDQAVPIGLKPHNLNFYKEIAGTSVNQLYYLISTGVLKADLPPQIASTVNYMDETQDLTLRVRSFLDINCAHCHSEGSHCDYRPLRLGFSETAINRNLGVCVEPDEYINPVLLYLVSPGRAERSVLHFRMSTEQENLRMPLLGRTVVHKEGLALISEWIKQINENCN